MTDEQRKAKEQAEKFLVYLYEKYYLQIEAEMEKREELRKCSSSRVLLKLGLPFFSYFRYNIRKRLRGRKYESERTCLSVYPC